MKKLILVTFLFCITACSFGQRGSVFSTNDYIVALKQATDIMVNDVTSPVAAARYYAYITLSANETASLFHQRSTRFSGLLKGLAVVADNNAVSSSEPSLATVFALYKSALRFLPSGFFLQKSIDSVKRVAEQRNVPVATIEYTMALADTVVNQIVQYAAGDGFSRLSGLKRFTPRNGDGYWQPTAPGFMAAVEPYWHRLRPFLIDSCSQFAGPPPAPYSTDTASSFYRQMKEVYTTGKNLTPSQADAAMFWDCNPFALQQVGHLEFGIKKISPGGHWIGITGIACKKQKIDMAQTAYVHALVSVALADAFIACWNEKYKYSRVRPVTVIKKLADRDWNPLLQTPPFPEYTSGHSVISTTAATVLTHLFGDHFSFSDDTEVEFGLPVRQFSSFSAAAREAAISRLYGGIHFRDAIEAGAVEGEEVGKLAVSRSPAQNRVRRGDDSAGPVGINTQTKDR